MSSEHKISSSQYNNHKKLYLLRIGDKDIYNSLQQIGLYPNKSTTMLFPDIPKKYLNSFVLGYFDGNGCVYIEKLEDKIKRLRIIFTCGRYEFLKILRAKLEENAGIKANIKKYSRAYRLYYDSSQSIKLFCWLYKDKRDGFFLKRKFDHFDNYFKLKPEKITDKVKRII